MRLYYLALLISTLILTGCEKIALLTIPKNKPIQSTSPLAHQAQRYFWQTLHSGRYQDISKADYLLTAAYLENPNDPAIAAHLGFLHIWKITERNRLAGENPLITNEIILSQNYFSDANELEPDNAIYEGFLGAVQLMEGKVFQDERQELKGYFTLKRAIAKWPQFNYFTAGYPMSSLPPESKFFHEGLEWQWLTLDSCIGKKINRKNPDYNIYMTEESQPHLGKGRACWNSSIAPYNFEGFFMNMGDMLVKSGDWQTGILIYKNARLAKNYSTWPYREMLEKRISNARQNVRYFQQDASRDPNHTIMFNSGYGCMACHQSKL
jgi:hypothetical protein